MEKHPLLHAVLDTAEDFKALDICAYDVSHLCSFADFFVFMTGTSSLHVQSIADAILLNLKKSQGLLPLGVEGKERGEWCLIDLGDVLVHIFLAEPRAFYGLENLWQQARRVFPPEASDEAMLDHAAPRDPDSA